MKSDIRRRRIISSLNTGFGSDPDEFPEYPGASLTEAIVTYTSSVDTSLTALKVRIYYPTIAPTLPFLLVLHGFEQEAIDIGEDTLRRFARYGYFVAAVEMRGSTGSGGGSGTRDANGLEGQDCYDAYIACKAAYAVIHATRASVVGFSGGFGVGMGLVSRYPDLFQVAVNYFGVSSYSAWYPFAGAPRQAAMQTYIGGTPAAAPDEYLSRNSVDAIAKNFQGYLYMFHDADDLTVPVTQSQAVVSAYGNEGRSDYYYNESNSGSTYRWSHGYPATFPDLIQAETYWKSAPKTYPIAALAAGTVRVNGYMRFKEGTQIWLGVGGARTKGKQRVASMVYDLAANTFIITPISAATSMLVTILRPDGRYISKVVTSGGTAVNPIITSSDIFLQYIHNLPSAILVDMADAGTYYYDGSNLMDIIANKVNTGINVGQGFVAATINRPDYIASGQNSLPVIRFGGSPERLDGSFLQGGVSMTKFTIIIANAGAGVSLGVSDNQRAQLNYASNNTFIVAANGSTSFAQEADTNGFSIRTLDFDGSLTGDANRLKFYENGVQSTIDSFTLAVPASVDFNTVSLLASLGKVPYTATFFTGDLAFFIFVPGGLSTVNRQAIENALRTRYAV